MKAFVFFTLLFLPLKSVFSQGLILTESKRLHEKAEERELLTENNPVFSGFYLTSFERTQPERWFSLETSITTAANREREVTIATVGTQNDPVNASTLLEGTEGLPLRYGENIYATINAEARARDVGFFKMILHGGQGFEEPQAWYFMQQLYGEVRLNKLVLSVGRKPIFWGQSRIGPILYSTNARNLDLIELSTIPVKWPWILKYLGFLKAEIFVSRLDAKREPANDYFAGWRIGIKPFDWMEGNVGMIYQFLGDGKPVGSFSDYFYEFLGARRSYSSNPNDSSDFTNRAFAGDLRFNFSGWRWPTSIYTEQHLEDCCGSISSLIQNTLSYTFGVYTRTSRDSDAHRLRIEYSKTGQNLYFHQGWPMSTSNGGRLAGNPLGRDAQGVYFDWARDFGKWESSAGFFWEQRERKGIIQNFDDGTKIAITAYRPNFKHSEKRYGMNLGSKFLFEHGLNLDLNTEVVRVTGKENADRKTFEWGLLASLTQQW
jgi:hypothetical protein